VYIDNIIAFLFIISLYHFIFSYKSIFIILLKYFYYFMQIFIIYYMFIAVVQFCVLIKKIAIWNFHQKHYILAV
jgi:hypothetical protein